MDAHKQLVEIEKVLSGNYGPSGQLKDIQKVIDDYFNDYVNGPLNHMD